jgi:ferredoxin
VYCCGPEGLLSAVEQQCAHWPTGTLHIERFAAKTPTTEQAAAALERFEVVCHRSGITVEVDSGASILEALEDANVPILGSCYEGVCGTCEAAILEGTPEHRDSVLTEAEQASGTVLLTCVSRSRTARLVLDV